jgi:hypothetical protein
MVLLSKDLGIVSVELVTCRVRSVRNYRTLREKCCLYNKRSFMNIEKFVHRS